MNDLAPNPPIVNWNGTRYELTSDQPMTLVSWGLPPSPTNGAVDPIVIEDSGPGTTIFIEIDQWAYLSKYYTLQPYVIIDEQLVKCPEVQFIGTTGTFLIGINHEYSPTLGIHYFYITNRQRNDFVNQCQVVTQVDGVNVALGTFAWPQYQNVHNFNVYEENYEKGPHELTITVISMGEERVFKYNIFGSKVAAMTFTETIYNQGTQDMLRLNTNRKSTVKIEVYVDSTLIQTILNNQISLWPLDVYLQYNLYEPVSHSWWCKIIDTVTSDQVETTHYTFTGMMPVKVPITYGADITAVADQISLARPPNKSILYKFNGTAGDQVRIAVNAISGSYDSLVSLYSPTMQMLVWNDSAGGGGNGLITSFILPTTGEYTIDSAWWAYTGNSGYLQTILTKLN